MKTINSFLLFTLLTLIGNITYAQRSVDADNYSIESRKEKKYHVKIELMNGLIVKGVIRSIGLNNIQLDEVVYRLASGGDAVEGDSSVVNIEYSDIQSIKMRGAVLAAISGSVVGSGAGALIGGFLGARAGFALTDCGDDPDCEEDYNLVAVTTVVGAGIFGVVGGVVGLVDGPFKLRFKIAGQHNKFLEFRERMGGKKVKME